MRRLLRVLLLFRCGTLIPFFFVIAFMGVIRVEDIVESNIDDVFKVCSHGRLNDSLQVKGIELRRKWIRRMIRDYGTCVKVAYLDEKPVAQLLFYPESAVPFISHPRKGVILLRCVYNPFEEARGMGASTALVKSLIEECKSPQRYLNGVQCSFIASEPFNTGEGMPMERFYSMNGFVRMGEEMIYKINGEYIPPEKPLWNPNKTKDKKAIIFYNPTCEYSLISALRAEEAIKNKYPALPVELIDQWEKPETSIQFANNWLIVNGTLIKSGLKSREAFYLELKEAVEKIDEGDQGDLL